MTEKYLRIVQARRYSAPPMPTVPTMLDDELAYNIYFQSLHRSSDIISSVLKVGAPDRPRS